MRSSTPRAVASIPNTSRMPSTSSTRSTGACSRSRWPASIFEKSRMSSIRPSSESADARIVRTASAWSSASALSASTSTMPMTPFIGVRISWLMVARNADLARLAVSASSRAVSSGRLSRSARWCARRPASRGARSPRTRLRHCVGQGTGRSAAPRSAASRGSHRRRSADRRSGRSGCRGARRPRRSRTPSDLSDPPRPRSVHAPSASVRRGGRANVGASASSAQCATGRSAPSAPASRRRKMPPLHPVSAHAARMIAGTGSSASAPASAIRRETSSWSAMRACCCSRSVASMPTPR